jgi:hypothetical protein
MAWLGASKVLLYMALEYDNQKNSLGCTTRLGLIMEGINCAQLFLKANNPVDRTGIRWSSVLE